MSEAIPADDLPIPDRLDELTPDWLTAALRSRGHLGAGRVAEVDLEPLGEGEGFMGVIARLHLTFDGDPGELPPTLIVKIPTGERDNRAMAELMGAYWREIHFYEELRDDVPARTPRAFYSDLTPDPMRPRQDGIVRVLDRLPALIVDPFTELTKRMTRVRAHRYVLLLEDLAPASVGDQVAGGTPADCAAVLAVVASMHARFWRSPELDRRFWISHQDVNPRMRHRMYLAGRPGFEARYGALMRETGANRLIDWLDRHGVALSRALHRDAPSTLLHCDLRFDNVFFDATRDPRVILADWQLTGAGAGAYDVAYLLSGTLAVETPDAVVQALLAGYHEALECAGVLDYPLDALQRDYRRALLTVLQTLATTDTVEMGNDRGILLMDLWTERCLALLRDVDPDAVLRG